MNSVSQTQRNESISIIRILATFFIIVCHLGTFYQSPVITQFFNVGVPIFFLISGYLYGQRTISKWKQWYIKRWCILMIPCYVWYIILAIFAFLTLSETPSIQYSFLLFFNLQGSDFLCSHIKTASYPGLGQLWFMTALMLCYFTLPVLQWSRGTIEVLKTSQKLWIVLVLFMIISLISLFLGLNLSYILIFSIGYFLGNKIFHLQHRLLYGVLLFSCGVCLRLLGKLYFDDTFLYNQIITTFTHTLIAVSLLIIIHFIYERYIRKWQSDNSHCITYVDSLTYYVYITHYFFLTGIVNVETFLPNHKILGALVVLVGASLSAILLKKLSEPLSNLLIKRLS
jgi:surface polysaccharide O-acyltransferase-like enzyme